MNNFLLVSFYIFFGCSKEPSHLDGSFEYPQHMFWLRIKKSNFRLPILTQRRDGTCRLHLNSFWMLTRFFLCRLTVTGKGAMPHTDQTLHTERLPLHLHCLIKLHGLVFHQSGPCLLPQHRLSLPSLVCQHILVMECLQVWVLLQ